MPWSVQKDDRCSASKPWAVIKQTDNSVEGCHPSREAGLKQAAALYASERMIDMDDRAAWSSAYITALPDSAFACVDEAGRHYPHHSAEGSVDLPHLRNALSRYGQPGTANCGRDHLEAHARAAGLGDRIEELGYERRVSSLTWPLLDFDLRAEQDGMRFRGYAAMFNSPSEPLPFIETIRPGAFAKTLRDRRTKKMFLNHNQDIVLGSTRRSLKLNADKRGLLAELDLPNNEWGRPVADAIRREDIDGMSFGFTTVRDEWQGTEQRELVEVDLHEVSIVTGFPAYSDTTVAIRNVVVPVMLHLERLERMEAALAGL